MAGLNFLVQREKEKRRCTVTVRDQMGKTFQRHSKLQGKALITNALATGACKAQLDRPVVHSIYGGGGAYECHLLGGIFVDPRL